MRYNKGSSVINFVFRTHSQLARSLSCAIDQIAVCTHFASSLWGILGLLIIGDTLNEPSGIGHIFGSDKTMLTELKGYTKRPGQVVNRPGSRVVGQSGPLSIT